MSRDIETKEDYEQYREDVAAFFEREGLSNLSWDSDEYPEGNVEPHFSWSPCDCCGGTLGGNRYICSGYNPDTKEAQTGYSVCEDCVYYAEYGRLDDMTMDRIGEE